jgi:hypothetical protein
VGRHQHAPWPGSRFDGNGPRCEQLKNISLIHSLILRTLGVWEGRFQLFERVWWMLECQ